MALADERARRRVYVVDGARTPFLKARTGLGPFTGSDLAVNAGRSLLLRQPFEADAFDAGVLVARLSGATPADALAAGCAAGAAAVGRLGARPS